MPLTYFSEFKYESVLSLAPSLPVPIQRSSPLLNMIVAHSTVLIPRLVIIARLSDTTMLLTSVSNINSFWIERNTSNRSPSLGMGPSVKRDFSTICLQKPSRKEPLDGKADRDLCYPCGEECSPSWFHPHWSRPIWEEKGIWSLGVQFSGWPRNWVI